MGDRTTADERFERQLRALGYALLRLQKSSEDVKAGEVRVFELRAKLDADNRTSVLLIVKGVRDGTPVVAFVGGPDLETAVISLSKKLMGDAVRWRDDPPWGGQ